MIDICKCGIARVDCEYHRSEPTLVYDEKWWTVARYQDPEYWKRCRRTECISDHTGPCGDGLQLLGPDDPEVSDDLIYATPTGGVVAVPRSKP